jgi:pyruvate-formate lyase-activating enzyme
MNTNIDELGSIGFYTLSDARARRVAEPRGLSNPPPLARCEILLGARCNFRCGYCRGVGGPDADPVVVARVLDAWIADGLQAVRFSGGEPTLWPHLVEAVAKAKKHIHRVAISTNGSAPWSVYQKLLDAGANDFSVSLDACCAADGETMAGVSGRWGEVVENIRRLASKTYTTVGIVLTEQNAAKLSDTVRFAAGLGVADIRVIPAAQHGARITVGPLPIDEPGRFPILRWRWERLRQGAIVRGIVDNDSKWCSLVRDDMAVMGDKHYPCIIYLREGGKPIGEVGPLMRLQRFMWSASHRCDSDPICSRNCLDFCVKHNNRVAKFAQR